MKIKIQRREGILKEPSETVTYEIRKIIKTKGYTTTEDIADLTSEEWESVYQAVREKYYRVQTEEQLKIWGDLYRKLSGGRYKTL